MAGIVDGTVDWAFALAPAASGWRVKFVPGGARLTTGGGTVPSVTEACGLMESLTPLLCEDESTIVLLRVLSRAQTEQSDRGMTTRGSDETDEDRDLLQTVWEASSDAMALSDPNGIVLHANPAYCRLYGYTSEEIIGHSFAIIFPETLREWAVTGYRQAFADPEIASRVEAVVQRADGTERTVDARYEFIVRDSKRIAMLSSIRDITERREAERLAQLRAGLIEMVQQAVIVADMDGTITYCNAAAGTIYGSSSEDLMGKNLIQLAVPQPGGQDAASILAELRGGNRWVGELALLRADGTAAAVTVMGDSIRDESGKIAGVVLVSTR